MFSGLTCILAKLNFSVVSERNLPLACHRMRLSRFILGKCPTLSIDKARKIVTKTLQDVANGTNPQANRVQQRMKIALGLDRAEMVAATWQTYIKKHANRNLTASTARKIKRIGEKHILPRIGKSNVAGVTPREGKGLVDDGRCGAAHSFR